MGAPKWVPRGLCSVSDLRQLAAVSDRRLSACARVLGIKPSLSAREYLQPPTQHPRGPTLAEVLAATDLYLLILEQLEDDRAKCALASSCKATLMEQRRVRPSTAYRTRVSLPVLLGARKAGWRLTNCHVDKRSGDWSAPRENGIDSDAFSDLTVLSVVGRPDCALLVLSPFTALTTMSRMRTLEFDTCAIGDAGVAVLAAAFGAGSMPSLEILDVRANQVGDAGAKTLAAAATLPNVLSRLQTLGLDYNRIGGAGYDAIAAALEAGALAALSCVYVDLLSHPSLTAACERRHVALKSW